MNRLDNPVDAGIATNGFVLRIDEDDFKVLVGGILIDPIRVQHSQIGATTSNTFFGSRLEGTLILELIDTLVRWLACVMTPLRLDRHRNGLDRP